MCDRQLGKVTVSLLRRLLPTRLTQVLTQGPGPPFWVQASHGRLPEAQQRCRGTEVRMLTLQGPHRMAHLAALRILCTHSRN